MTRMPPGTQIAVNRWMLLVITTTSLTIACASAGRSLPAPRPAASANHVRQSAGVWSCLEGLPLGSPLVVTLHSGDRMEGAFRGLRADVLLLTDPVEREFNFPISEVRAIELKTSDDLRNGVLIGAAVGLGAALAILMALGAGDGYVLPSAKWGAPLLLSSVGGVIGALVDRARKSNRVVCFAGDDKSRVTP